MALHLVDGHLAQAPNVFDLQVLIKQDVIDTHYVFRLVLAALPEYFLNTKTAEYFGFPKNRSFAHQYSFRPYHETCTQYLAMQLDVCKDSWDQVYLYCVQIIYTHA